MFAVLVIPMYVDAATIVLGAIRNKVVKFMSRTHGPQTKVLFFVRVHVDIC